MKAFLLAAGLGTRLRPITNVFPKCMVPIDGRPLIDWWMQLFAKHNIDEVLVNTHYLPDPVRDYIEVHNRKKERPYIVESYEEKLLGSGGTVRTNIDFVKNEKEFLICYADNLTNLNLTELLQIHRKHNGILTMALFHTNKPKQCGIAVLDEKNCIVEFVEKPALPKGDLANAGVYAVSSDVFSYIPNQPVSDFGKDVLPLLVGRMYGYKIRDYLLDIGTLDNYKKAQEEWKS